MTPSSTTASAAAEILATLYVSQFGDQYGIAWIKARAAALGYATDITKRGPRSMYAFRSFDGTTSATVPVTLPKARQMLDTLENRQSGMLHDIGQQIGRHPNPTAYLDRMTEAFVALVANQSDARTSRGLFQRVPLAARL